MPLLRRVCTLALFVTAVHAPALESVPKAEYHDRRVHLAAELAGGAALIFAAEYPAQEYQSWRQNEDFYYLTGWNSPGAALLVEAASVAPTGRLATLAALQATAGAPAAPSQGYREILFLPERNYLEEVFTGRMPDASTAGIAQQIGVDEVRPLSALTAELVRVAANPVARANLNGALDQNKTKAAFTAMSAALGSGEPDVAELHNHVRELRAVKSAAEIALLQKAADASVAAHFAMMAATHDGQRERTISGLIDYKLKENGCERPSYPSVVGSGVHSTELHYEADDDTLHSGDVMVVDAAGEYSMYASDVTRTVPVNGHFTARQREIYNIVLAAQQAAIDSFVTGRSNLKPRSANDLKSLDSVAFQYINTHGKDLHGEPLGKYFMHGVGHGVGIDVHDWTSREKNFGPGSVFTIEPGIYIPEEKIGVRIEDTFYVNARGKLVALTGALPKSAEDMEKLVQQGSIASASQRTGAIRRPRK